MKRETYLTIPQQCHESWDAMTLQDKGRFCASCAKTVIDFSQMSDIQVLNYLSQAKGRLCGRFAQDQIERPLIPVKIEKKKIWWMVALMPLSLLLNKVNAQKIANEKTSITKEIYIATCTGTMRRHNIIEDIQLLTNTIQGNVKDQNGNPLPLTTVSILDNHLQTTTDENGHFSLKLINPHSDTKILISDIGYEQKEIGIGLSERMTIVLKKKQIMLPEVCVKSTDAQLSSTIMGGLVVSIGKITRKDTIATKVRKIFYTNSFKVFPNPAIRGAALHIEVKSAGHYSIQLLDVNSKLITYSLFDAVKDATSTTFTIPSSATAGMYLIRLINDDTKQQYTDKIMVQKLNSFFIQ
jgi:hypothetical protein